VPVINKHFNTVAKKEQIQAQEELSELQQFRRRLKDRAREFVRYVLEEIMDEEMTAFIGAEWGEQGNPDRTGQRNGFYTRTLYTTTGQITDLKVPRDRAGQFQSQVFERYNRYEPEIEAAVEEMYVAGVSQRRVADVTEKLVGARPSPKRVAKMTEGLSERFEQWKKRALEAHYRAIYLDAVYYPIVYEDKADQTAVLVALGVNQAGEKEVLSIMPGAEESCEAWEALLADLKARKVEQVDLFVTDGGEGLLAALRKFFVGAKRQRCVTHKMRNVLSHVPNRKKKEIGAALKQIFEQTSREKAIEEKDAFVVRYAKVYSEAVKSLLNDFEACLTFLDFPPAFRRYIRTTNALEGLFSNIRLRTNSVKVFQNEASCLLLVWAASQAIKLQRIPVA
jgi:putative transposase